LRAFAAIPLPVAFAAWLEPYRKTLNSLETAVRLVPAISCHMTLRFLGEVPERQLEEMMDRLSHSLAGTAAVQIVLDQTGVFLRDGRPSVLWLGPSMVPAGLTDLVAKVDRVLSGFGSNSRVEHFSPHVTLGRFVSGLSAATVAALLEKVVVPPFPVDAEKVVLFESVLGQGHPTYIPRATVALGYLPNKTSELY
jgi:RNA 2',3'-cyclic 3'-phosphodiesterase